MIPFGDKEQLSCQDCKNASSSLKGIRPAFVNKVLFEGQALTGGQARYRKRGRCERNAQIAAKPLLYMCSDELTLQKQYL